MHARQGVPPELLQLAEAQEHTLSRSQCRQLEMNRHTLDRMVESGWWRRLGPGVFQTHPLEPTWSTRAWAGVLIGGDTARIGGTAAGHVHGFVKEPPEPITVWIPPGAYVPQLEGWAFRREPSGLRARTRHFDPPTIGVEDAVLDIVAEHTDDRRIMAVVVEAVGQRLTTARRLRERMAERPRLRHRALLEELTEEVASGALSPLEITYLHEVERAHDLPTGVRQLRRSRTYCDVCYAEYGLLIELDGRLGHTGSDQFRDMARDNDATTQGLATLRFGAQAVYGEPCEVAHQMGHTLGIRS